MRRLMVQAVRAFGLRLRFQGISISGADTVGAHLSANPCLVNRQTDEAPGIVGFWTKDQPQVLEPSFSRAPAACAMASTNREEILDADFMGGGNPRPSKSLS